MLWLLLPLLLPRPPPGHSMGCGPSTIINPRKWRSRAQSNNSGSDAGSDEDGDEAAQPSRRAVAAGADEESSALLAVAAAVQTGDGGGEGGAGGAGTGGTGGSGVDVEDDAARAAAARLRLLAQNAPGPLLSHTYVPHIEVSVSQQDFFRVLDMKVESGPELNPDDDNERLREAARLSGLVREWQRSSHVARDHREPRDALPHHQDALHRASPRASLRAKADQDVHGVHGVVLARPARHAAQQQYPSTSANSVASAPHDTAWRRLNLSWVPEQRPVGGGVAPGLGQGVPGVPLSGYTPAQPNQAYPGRAVPTSAWPHGSYQGYDSLGSPWYSSMASAPQGFRPYRSEAGSQPSHWPEPRADFEEPLLYHGNEPYYPQQPYGLGLRYGHIPGPGIGTGLGLNSGVSSSFAGTAGLGPGIGSGSGLGHPSRHPDMANSMVQLDKSGGTRTELA